MCSSWSTRICLVSYSRRPIKVDLPSSTDPAVTSRSSSVSRRFLEVANALPIFHRCFRDAVVCTCLAPFRHPRRRDLADHGVDRCGVTQHAPCAGHIAHGPETNGRGEGLLVRVALHEARDGVEHAVAPEHLAVVGEVDLRQLEVLARDVLPHVELRPVRDREDADLLALTDACVVDVPQLGALSARVPLAEVVAEAEDALLCAGALFVTAGAAHRGVEAVLLERIQQR